MAKEISGSHLIDPALILEKGGVRVGQTVADFGCGATGHFVFPAARIVGNEGLVYAIDIQKAVLSAVEGQMRLRNVFNIEPLWGDIESVGGVRVPDQTFDVSLIINNLFIAADRPMLMQEVFRTTKSGGGVVVVDWNTNNTPVGPPTDQRGTVDQAKDLAAQNGFSFGDPFRAGQYHWGLVCKRA